MNDRTLTRLAKHLDFVVLDIACMQACFVGSCWLCEHLSSPYTTDRFSSQGLLLATIQLALALLSDSYHGILRRKKYAELLAVLKYVVTLFVVFLLVLFAVHRVSDVSRLQIGLTLSWFCVTDFLARQLNKARLRRKGKGSPKQSMVLVASSIEAHQAVRNLRADIAMRDHTIAMVVLLDRQDVCEPLEGIPVRGMSEETLDEIIHGWVDKVFILQSEGVPLPDRLMDSLAEADIEVDVSPSFMRGSHSLVGVENLGAYQALKLGIREVSPWSLAIKRAGDILGGLLGCVLTAIVFVFVAPAIRLSSPGPVFFTQERVGKNGKTFRMYKFRSMYVDADQHKDELRDQNEMAGPMFKVKNDPRIIGNGRTRKDGTPAGIGHFIRRYSIDELPQFYNVLRGEMSMVGTRPPTIDEWNQYQPDHRARMGMKPGITGLWQVSGRSKVTDFDSVVALDREYIENWTISMDVAILIKTVGIVFLGRDAY